MSDVHLSKKYTPLFDQSHGKRYIIITGGRGSGKSFGTTTYACSDVWQNKGKRILYSRYTMTAAEISIIPEFTEKIELLGGQNIFNIKSKEIICKGTGSDILFRGIKTSSGNQTAKLKSIQGVTTFILDEAEEMESERDFDTIDLSIRQQGVKNTVILIMNPTTKEHWIYQRWFEGYIDYIDIDGYKIPITTHPEVVHIHTTYLDNINNLDQSFIDQLLSIKAKNPEKYKNVVLGGWLEKAEGVIFEDWEIGEFDTSLPHAYGLDFGYSPDPTAFVKVAVDKRKEVIYLEECFYNTKMDTAAIREAVTHHIDNPRDLVIADNAEKRLIQELAKRVNGQKINIIPCRKGQGSVRAGLLKMLSYKIVVTKESRNIQKELNNYVWNDKKSTTPADDYNHAIDAARYAVDMLTLKKGGGIRAR